MLTVRYARLPVDLDRSYALYKTEPATAGDSLSDSLGIASRIAPTEQSQEPFLGNLQRSGSISRGFQLGSNRDLALTSGFNLQFSGDLAEDVTVTGTLSEESTPIQPEGTTQTLQDVDRIFITVKAGDHLNATLGDFNASLNAPESIGAQYQSRAPLGISTGRNDPLKAFAQSSFDVLTRKLLGAEGSLHYENVAITGLGASSRGQHNTNTFQGQEAFQGPYRMTGKNGERAILIIAGSERVYVDGQLQVRGERNDYVIDYGVGEVRFEPRRLITSDSKIVIDFEYSDQQYSRSLIAASGTGNILNDRLQVTATYMREGDNPDAPIDLSLSDTDRSIIARAGTDRLAASRSGVTLAGRDTAGRARGSYVKVDTLQGGEARTVYVYAPLDTVNALYNVSFGYAGANNGSYIRQGIGQFRYVGAKSGDYDTLRFLPLPQLDQIIAFHGFARISDYFGLTGEFATSAFAENRLSNIGDLTGNAYRFGAIYADTIPLLGYAELRATERRVGDAFRPFDRTQDVDFFRRYGNDRSQEVLNGIGERTREAALMYRPVSALQFDVTYGSLERSQLGFSSARTYSKAEIFEDSTLLPHVIASYEHIPVTDTGINERAAWDREIAEAAKTIHLGSSQITLGGRAGAEQKLAHSLTSSSDSLHTTSFSYKAIGPFGRIGIAEWLAMSADLTWRSDDSARGSVLMPVGRSTTGRGTLALTNIGGFSSNIDLTVRQKRYDDSVTRLRAGGDQRTMLLRFEPRYQVRSGGLDINALYEVSDQRGARQERVFLPVQPGYGSYKYLGDLNHNGKADPNEFEIARYANEATYILVTVPTEQLYPVIALRSNARLRIAPRTLFGISDSSSTLLSAIGALSSETFVQLSETSTDENSSDIYLLKRSHLLNPATTVHGDLSFEQDLNILESNPVHSYRLHFMERRQAGQFNTGFESAYLAERSVRIRLRPAYEFNGETILQSGTDLSHSDSLSLNRPNNTSILSGSTDWTYHPVGSAFDYSLRFDASRALEHSISPELTALSYALTGRTSYALESQARLRAELERDELTLSGTVPTSYLLPYALTAGRTLGVTWLWRLSLDYQFASGFIATLAYDGRNEAISGADRQTVHNARAEVRASF